MSKNKHKVFNKETKDNEVHKLKEVIKKKDREIKELRSQIVTYESAFKKTKDFLKENTDEFSVEQAIEAAKKNSNLKQMRNEYHNECSACGSDNVRVDKLSFGEIIICKNEDCGKTVVKKNGV